MSFNEFDKKHAYTVTKDMSSATSCKHSLDLALEQLTYTYRESDLIKIETKILKYQKRLKETGKLSNFNLLKYIEIIVKISKMLENTSVSLATFDKDTKLKKINDMIVDLIRCYNNYNYDVEKSILKICNENMYICSINYYIWTVTELVNTPYELLPIDKTRICAITIGKYHMWYIM